MICLIQFLFWEATGKIMPCKGDECRWIGGDTCYAAEGDKLATEEWNRRTRCENAEGDNP